MIDGNEKHNSWLNLKLQSLHAIERCYKILEECFTIFCYYYMYLGHQYGLLTAITGTLQYPLKIDIVYQ